MKWCPVNFWCLWTNSCLCWGKVLKIINLNFPRLHKFCITCIPLGLICGNILKNTYYRTISIFLSNKKMQKIYIFYAPCIQSINDCSSTDIVKLFPGSAFMGVNYGWECLLQTEDNGDRRSGHVQSGGRGDGECFDPDLSPDSEKNRGYIPLLRPHLLIIVPVVF